LRKPGWLAVGACTALISLVGSGTVAWRAHASGSGGVAPAAVPAPARSEAPTRVLYVHYYLWWTGRHWQEKLGTAYPLGAAPAPAPGRLDAQGCNPQSLYPGAEIVDLPAEGQYDQGQPSIFDHHIDLAARAGIAGFLVSWRGTGARGQRPASSGYNSRLDLLVSRVNSYNAAHGTNFGLGLAFAAFGDYARPAEKIAADLDYFATRYGRDHAFRNPYESKPVVMWLDSRKHQLATVAEVSAGARRRLYLVGDETEQSWPRDARYLDGTSYYWSTENPWANPRAGATLETLAAEVRKEGKRWFAPLIAGYNKQLLGGSCVPRRGVETLSKIWETNLRSRPDGWFAISWNELVENTHLEPSLAYGSLYLDRLTALIRS
jgi:hypothetical protein